MFASVPVDALALAQERARDLRATAAAQRQCSGSGVRRLVAGSLRRAGDRLDPTRLAPRSATQS